MADKAELEFVKADGTALCSLAVYVQSSWAVQSSGLEPLAMVPVAQALADGEAPTQLLEGVRYEYALSNDQYRLALAQHYNDTQGIILQSRMLGRAHCGVLNPGLATGQLPLVVQDVNGAVLARASLEVRSRKLNYKADYQQMLGDITTHCMDLLQELRAPSVFNAEPDPGKDPATIAQRFAFVRALLQSPSFDNALHRITSHPHHMWTQVQEERVISRGFKPSGKVLRQLVQGSHRVSVSKTHPLHAMLTTLPERVTVTRALVTEDTPENRFIKFALQSFHRFLTAMHKAVTDPIKDARLLQEISVLCTRLDEALASDVLRHVGELTFLPLGSPTLQQREGYREVLQAWLNFAMAAKLVWHGGEQVFGAGQRDVATLYEYWVFFELLTVVSKVFKLDTPVSADLLEPTADGFGLKLKAGKFIPIKGRSTQPGRELEVQFSYNRSFRATCQPRASGSWTENLRPDYTLSLWPVGFSADEAELQELMVHVHFDAKYRIDHVAALLHDVQDEAMTSDEALGVELELDKREEARGTYKRADLLKMHAYRDAIRRTQGAYVIYPGQAGADKRLESFHEVLPGLGAFALRPGLGTNALEVFLRDVVSHVANRASAREQSSFHTWRTYEAHQSSTPSVAQEESARYGVAPEKAVGSALRAAPLRETFVLVGWVKDVAHLEWILKKGKYNFRMGSTPGALRLSAQVVGATYLLLHGDKNVVLPRLLRIINPADGPLVHSAKELTAMSYPSSPTQATYLVYDVEHAPEFEEMKWDSDTLHAKSDTVALGHPFATTLYDVFAMGLVA